MNKKTNIFLIFSLSLTMLAQQTTLGQEITDINDNTQYHPNIPSFTFIVDESQINDQDGSSQTLGSIGNTADDIYLKSAGLTFSPMRFSIRGYNPEYESIYINGVSFNDGERGRFNYSGLAGMNTIFGNRTISSYTEANDFSYGDLAGASYFNVKPADYPMGADINIIGTNRVYKASVNASYSTGIRHDGWAFTASMNCRWANRTPWEGTFYHSWGYFLGLEKIFNKHHRLSFVTYGAPIQRGQQGAVTQEVQELVGSIYYNPNWGYQETNKKNARIVRNFDPTFILSYEWAINQNQRLNMAAGVHYNNYSSTALSFYDAPDPRPDYYQNLPSFQTTPDMQQWVTNLWKKNKKYRQIAWDNLHQANYLNNEVNPDGIAKYIIEERHHNLIETTYNAVYDNQISKILKMTGGIEVKYSKGMHYKTLNNLLSGNQWIDIAQFPENESPANSAILQNDLENPSRIIKENDIFGYDYDINIYKVKVFVQNKWNLPHIDFYYAAKISYTHFFRQGYMCNGRAEYINVQSKGKGKSNKFVNPSFKFGFGWVMNPNNRISLNLLVESRAPWANSIYIAPRIKDTCVPNPQSEKILSYDLNYTFNYHFIKGRISGFRTHYKNVTESTSYYDDNYRTFINSSISGLNKLYQGIEAAATFYFNNKISVTLTGTWGDYTYTNNGNGVINAENGAFADVKDKVITKGIYENTGPQIAAGLSANYIHPKMWFIQMAGSYYAKNYLEFAPSRYIQSIINQYTPEQRRVWATQEELPDGFMLDVSVGKSIYLKNKNQRLNINLALNNLLNNTHLITGGYQQGSLPLYRDRKPSQVNLHRFPNKYYYAQGFNLTLNIGYLF